MNALLISKKSACTVLLTTLCILLLPLIAMNFSNEVNWGLADFIVAGILFSSFAYLYIVLTKATSKVTTRFLIGTAVVALFIVVWVSLI
jgi:hypothetical protein